MRLLILTEDLWIVELGQLPLVEYKDLVTIDDSVDAMCDSEDCRVFEGFFYYALNLLLGDYVDVGGCLVQNHDFVLAKDCPADAEELFLAGAERVAAVV
jgi:hypothetical protein